MYIYMYICIYIYIIYYVLCNYLSILYKLYIYIYIISIYYIYCIYGTCKMGKMLLKRCNAQLVSTVGYFQGT